MFKFVFGVVIVGRNTMAVRVAELKAARDAAEAANPNPQKGNLPGELISAFLVVVLTESDL
mgnify:CR=1 FL=1